MAEQCCSQLGSGLDAVVEEASQPLPGGEEALASQPLPSDDDPPSAVFTCEYGTQHGAQQQFSLPVRHGAKVYLGRPGAGASGAPTADRATITTSAMHGISRENGWIEYHKHRGVVLVPLHRQGFPAFYNEALLPHDAPPVVLSHGDVVGFGGSNGSKVTATTVRYRCALVNMPPVEPIYLPPPSHPVNSAGSGEDCAQAEGSGMASGGNGARSERVRGESSRAAKRRRKEAAAAAPAVVEAPVSALQAQASQAQLHTLLVASLSSEQRRWARRALDCTADCYGLIQAAVAEAAVVDGGSADVLHQAIARVLHKVQALAGDSARVVTAERAAARTERSQHEARDHAAQRRHDGRGGHGPNRRAQGKAPGRRGQNRGRSSRR